MQYKSNVLHFTTYKNGTDAIQYYTWIKYADSPTSGMSDLPENKTYIGIAYNKTEKTESTNYGDYDWSLIKGTDGVDGADGDSYYTWIKYADDINGTNMSDDPTGKYYIGLAYNKESNQESEVASDYTWSLFRGSDGVDGKNGESQYLHIKYANLINGEFVFTDTDGEDIGDYIGMYVDTIKEDSLEIYKYEPFKKIVGEKGEDGAEIIYEYAVSDSPTVAPTESQYNGTVIESSNTKLGTPIIYFSEWSTTIPIRENGQYIWQRIIHQYPNGTYTIGTPICITGDKGNDGTGVTILGSYNSLQELTAKHPTGELGDSYLVNGDLYVWSATTNAWENVGNIQGPQGPQGPQGTQGEKGEKGDTGEDGTDATVKSDTPPEDTSKLWLNTSVDPNILMSWDGSKWVRVNDHTQDIEKAINNAELTVDKAKATINATVSEKEEELLKKISALQLELEQIKLEVTSINNKTEFTKGEDIQEWESNEVPTLMNYPTFTDFFIWDYCSDELYCSDDLISGINDYQAHENEVLLNETNLKYYMFLKGEDELYYWKELTDEEYKEVSNYYSTVMVLKEKVRIENFFNENVGYAEISHEGLRASQIYCC
ncbi:hypothetical protein [Methanobrevibacter sp.]|uniref:hypothetical protein n=1 Tax=Methanobrevibacter sp. TaxID=66852 RepID=UPI00388EF0E1